MVFNNLTLDGVIQAPGRLEEDQRGGFQHGGWAALYGAMQSSEAGESMSSFGSLLLGRRTYEGLYDYWPKQSNNPFTEVLNNMLKYVASTSLEEPLPWCNSTLLKGSVPAAVTALKAQQGDDLVRHPILIALRYNGRVGLIDHHQVTICPANKSNFS